MTEEIKPTGYNNIRHFSDEKSHLVYHPIYLYNNVRHSTDEKLI